MAKDQIRRSTRASSCTIFINIFINELILAAKKYEVCNFGEDATIYAFGKDVESVVLSIKKDLLITHNCFKNNHIAASPRRLQVTFLGLKEEPIFHFQDLCIDSQLRFDDHVKNPLPKK